MEKVQLVTGISLTIVIIAPIGAGMRVGRGQRQTWLGSTNFLGRQTTLELDYQGRTCLSVGLSLAVSSLLPTLSALNATLSYLC